MLLKYLTLIKYRDFNYLLFDTFKILKMMFHPLQQLLPRLSKLKSYKISTLYSHRLLKSSEGSGVPQTPLPPCTFQRMNLVKY